LEQQERDYAAYRKAFSGEGREIIKDVAKSYAITHDAKTETATYFQRSHHVVPMT